MNIEEYSHLSAEADRILHDRGLHNLIIFSLARLHVVSEHPTHLLKYENKQSAKNAFVVFIIRSLFNLLRSFKSLKLSLPPRPCTTTTLLFSHHLAANSAKSDSDFYYGLLPRELVSRGIFPVVSLHNHCSISGTEYKSHNSDTGGIRLHIPRFLPPLEELKIILLQLFAFAHSSLYTIDSSCDYLSKLNVDCLLSSTSANLRFYLFVRKLSQHYNANSVIATFEGHPWERLAFLAVRAHNPSVRCIAYQHTVAFPNQHGIRRSLGQSYDPDIIAFAGQYSLNWFLASSNYSCPLTIVGTPRFDPVRLDISQKYYAALTSPSCLLLPDGTNAECFQFLALGLACAKALPTVTFILRLHPVVPLQSILDSPILANKSSPRNLVFSSLSIEEDFERNFWSIYRASGAGVRAAMAGLRPIYFSQSNSNMPINPLSNLFPWQVTIATPSDVIALIQSDLSFQLHHLANAHSCASRSLESYFSRYNPELFSDLVAR